MRRCRAASPARGVPAGASSGVTMSTSHLCVMPSREDLQIQGTSQAKCHAEGLAIMSQQDEWPQRWARHKDWGLSPFARGNTRCPTADGQGAASPRGGTAERCQDADTVPAQGPRAGQQLGGGFPSSCPSPRSASHPEHGCKRLSCDRQLPVRSRLGAGAAGRSLRCWTLSPCHRPQRHAAPQAFQRRGQGAGTQEGECWRHPGALSTADVPAHAELSDPGLPWDAEQEGWCRGLGQGPEGWDSTAAGLPSVCLCCHQSLWPRQRMVLALSSSHSPRLPSSWDAWLGYTASEINMGASSGAGGTPRALLGEAVPSPSPHGLPRRGRPPVISWGGMAAVAGVQLSCPARCCG